MASSSLYTLTPSGILPYIVSLELLELELLDELEEELELEELLELLGLILQLTKNINNKKVKILRNRFIESPLNLDYFIIIK
jgi:hypothetical protein